MLFLVAREKAGAFELTPGQLAVARLIAEGRSYKQAAVQLGVSVATVRNQLHGAYVKLGVHNKVTLSRLLADEPYRSSSTPSGKGMPPAHR